MLRKKTEHLPNYDHASARGQLASSPALRFPIKPHLFVDDLPELRHAVEGLLPRDVGHNEGTVETSEGIRRQATLLLFRYLYTPDKKKKRKTLPV